MSQPGASSRDALLVMSGAWDPVPGLDKGIADRAGIGSGGVGILLLGGAAILLVAGRKKS
jgi:hypothetical protein